MGIFWGNIVIKIAQWKETLTSGLQNEIMRMRVLHY